MDGRPDAGRAQRGDGRVHRFESPELVGRSLREAGYLAGGTTALVTRANCGGSDFSDVLIRNLMRPVDLLPYGMVVGGLLLGVSEAVTSRFVSTGYKEVPGFVLLILIILFKPSGLFGEKRPAAEL